MEIKINKDITKFTESTFFGLSLRQFICAALAIGAAVGVYFLLRDLLGKETASWICILAAAPIAAVGFFRYNRMNAEQFLRAVIKSQILYSGKRVYRSENIYYNALQEGKKKRRRRK